LNGLDHLTIPQLETGASDLRNAALVVEHAGHTKGTLFDHEHGTVCAAGAIDLATYRRLGYIGDPLKRYVVIDSFSDSEHYRAENAYVILADFLPGELCDACDYTKVCDCPDHDGVPHVLHEGTTPWEKLIHYNDRHCSGGQLLSNLLRLAADRAELAIFDRRRMLTGSVLSA